MKARVNDKTKLVFIANPNNPTGSYVSRVELESFCAGLPQNTIVVLDEAYDAFIDVDDYPSGISYLGKKNIITLKTFSKGYGLAGVRIGYSPTRNGRPTWNVPASPSMSIPSPRLRRLPRLTMRSSLNAPGK